MSWGIEDKTVSFAAEELCKSRGCVFSLSLLSWGLFRHRAIPAVGLSGKWKKARQAECESNSECEGTEARSLPGHCPFRKMHDYLRKNTLSGQE